MGVCNSSMFCCTLLYVHSSIAIILMGKRELIALLNLSSWCLVMVERLFLAVPRGCLQFVIVVFPDHTHLLFFFSSTMSLLCFTVMFVAIFHRHFYCDSFTREEDCIPNLPCTQRPFGNDWAPVMFRGPDFIAKLSDGLKIIDPIFITCDDIGKLLFVTSLKHLKHILVTLSRCLFCSSVNRCGTHLANIFQTFKCFFKRR